MNTLFARLALLGLLMIALSAQAQQTYSLSITNDTGYTILALQVSPADAQAWEEDVLGDQVLMNGNTSRIELSGYHSPMFDIRAIDEDGDTYTFFGINVMEQDLTITLADLDVD
jgi:hypothetical protein